MGLARAFEAAMAGRRVPWCTHLAEIGWSDGFAGLALLNSGTAAREILREAILLPSERMYRVDFALFVRNRSLQTDNRGLDIRLLVEALKDSPPR
jgi:hypothetical protein